MSFGTAHSRLRVTTSTRLKPLQMVSSSRAEIGKCEDSDVRIPRHEDYHSELKKIIVPEVMAIARSELMTTKTQGVRSGDFDEPGLKP